MWSLCLSVIDPSRVQRLRRNCISDAGITYPGEAGMGAMLRRAAITGAKLAVHAVGNGSVEAVLRALAADPALANAVPMRVEHAIAADPELARRLGDANIPVVAQPIFLTAFGHELNLVPVPMPLRLMPFRTQLEAGVPLVFSTDYPAAELNPWQGVSAAVTRFDEVGWPTASFAQ